MEAAALHKHKRAEVGAALAYELAQQGVLPATAAGGYADEPGSKAAEVGDPFMSPPKAFEPLTQRCGITATARPLFRSGPAGRVCFKECRRSAVLL